MSHTTASRLLAGATASMVSGAADVTGALAALLAGVAELTPADAAAVLVETESGSLELLAATSHRAADLEMYQVQADEGPCVDSIRTSAAVVESGTEAIRTRWPVTGPAIVASGYAAVVTAPLHWHGRSFGALNLFRTEADIKGSDAIDVQPFADAATMLIVSTHLSESDLTASIREALEGRAVVERAKGALAHVRSIDTAEAFEALVRLAEDERAPLGETARRVMDRARSGTLR
jgi:acetylornithine/succinyldiaminopimelate/putrescine aminotransferase